MRALDGRTLSGDALDRLRHIPNTFQFTTHSAFQLKCRASLHACFRRLVQIDQCLSIELKT
jgi:hypothetical protein